MLKETYSERLTEVQARIAAAARRSGRDPDAVSLVAVSKTHPPEAVAALAEAGQTLFGENRVQEARAKAPLLSSALRWHLVGHLQRNKVRQAVGLFEMIQSVDSSDLAESIHRVAEEQGIRCRVLLEVNVAGEATKFGFSPEALERDIEALLGLSHIDIEGLMCIPPPVAKPDEARPYFARLRELRDRLETHLRVPLATLSMGMSGDYEVAIEEGATFVRVGSALFGERSGKTWRPKSDVEI